VEGRGDWAGGGGGEGRVGFCAVRFRWKREEKKCFIPDNNNRFAWAACALPDCFFPVGLGEAVRQLAALCEYPGKRARFHACYYDLKEDVDYNYLSVPMRACEGLEGAMEALKEMGPIEVQVYDGSGKLTESKRTLPIAMHLKSFPSRVLLLRQFEDVCLMFKEDVNEALDKCSAASSAG